jgi:hypothetical protein
LINQGTKKTTRGLIRIAESWTSRGKRPTTKLNLREKNRKTELTVEGGDWKFKTTTPFNSKSESRRH